MPSFPIRTHTSGVCGSAQNVDADEVRVAFRFRVMDDRITAIDLIADRAALAQSVIERVSREPFVEREESGA